MAINPEGEDVLRQAAAIFEESRQAAQELSVSVTIKTFIRTAACVMSIETRGVEEDKELGEKLNYKLFAVGEQQLATSRRERGTIPQTVTIGLNAREMDLVNKYLLRQISMSRSLGKKNSSYLREEAFESIKDELGCLIELNDAFIRAGGLPRPEFTKFREGL